MYFHRGKKESSLVTAVVALLAAFVGLAIIIFIFELGLLGFTREGGPFFAELDVATILAGGWFMVVAIFNYRRLQELNQSNRVAHHGLATLLFNIPVALAIVAVPLVVLALINLSSGPQLFGG